MAWSTPLTAVSNAALTAAQWNASVRDNLLTTAPALASATGQHFIATGANTIAPRLSLLSNIATNETTAATTYGDLTTVGPSLTPTVSTACLVSIACRLSNTTAGAYSSASVSYGATNGDLTRSFTATSAAASQQYNGSFCYLHTGLTPGSIVFTMKYAVSGGSGSFVDRRLSVIPF